ncbi:hypothetical protein A3D66_02730 [Candidatus Kaiserbacteria bacterium RIFCSPHIGHO2_02_FULL_50_9]|uniref:UPF0102 protein A3A35_00790 n=1 Tax=Candidatus Kaiserbacteria bacterium RIFCSPLOWO2_01_FULL_51_21 TaxID=1798508 RepID=A0A1F6EDD7_9BACT|nr:MAG: hypothetical protein A2761_02700 [Candidatus Kaiserbacteria bacterium RIFCSPHIGHO2_01_FULL_51_33]OGG63694.1 MAG: hypothetical protein A3D66_02730 [Candidatus Kaiserbacteria bacterium RIFCSPHIGHO2_02_FULL_50_9]OGG71685.1 MAG: hypothetical protein A3A35_00790 [Candidatus Kaiserbacteria bacterium RIFCSPLOWO2_01_FULL_51_21]
MKKETEKQKIGRIGEETASRFLVGKGFSILGKNYRKKWGEIDLIVKKGEIVRFVEVKTVSRENLKEFSRDTLPDSYAPEENVHPWKLKRLNRAIQTYLIDKKLEDAEWQLDVATVFLDLKRKEARVELIENISM